MYSMYVPMYSMYDCKQNKFPEMDNKIELNWIELNVDVYTGCLQKSGTTDFQYIAS